MHNSLKNLKPKQLDARIIEARMWLNSDNRRFWDEEWPPEEAATLQTQFEQRKTQDIADSEAIRDLYSVVESALSKVEEIKSRGLSPVVKMASDHLFQNLDQKWRRIAKIDQKMKRSKS
jgi:hypothetical protein